MFLICINAVPLYVAYFNRALTRFARAKQAIESGELGCVTSVSAVYSGNQHIVEPKSRWMEWRINPVESGGGLFMDLGCHTLDILDFLLGPLCNVKGDAIRHSFADPDSKANASKKVETGVAMTFRTQAGVLGNCTWDFCSAFQHDELRICGTKGYLTMSMFEDQDMPVLRDVNGNIGACKQGKVEQHIQQPLIQLMVDELRRTRLHIQLPTTPMPSTGASALRTAYVMDAVLRSYYKDRSDHYWKRPSTWEQTTVGASSMRVE